VGATWATRSKTLSMISLLPTMLEKCVALLEGALEMEVLFFSPVAGDGERNIGQEFFVVPGLLDESFQRRRERLQHVVDGA